MLPYFWWCVLIFLFLLYFLRSFRRLIFFIFGNLLGHAWLIYRRLTANSPGRKEKREYLEQNPQWREFKQQLETTTASPEGTKKGTPSASTTSSIASSMKPSGSNTPSTSYGASTTKTPSYTPSPAAAYSPARTSRSHSSAGSPPLAQYKSNSSPSPTILVAPSPPPQTTTGKSWSTLFKSKAKPKPPQPAPVFSFNGRIFE